MAKSFDGILRKANIHDFLDPEFVNVFTKNGVPSPNPLISFSVIGEKDGKVAGFCVLQPVYHLEPIYVSEEFRETDLHNKLMENMLSVLKLAKNIQVFVFAPNHKIEHLAEKFGFDKLDWKVLEQRF